MACPIPGNPDIAGIGVRGATYAQNILSFLPAFYALMNDKKVDKTELDTVEKQSTTILITAFAILISLVVQALTFNLSAFHTSTVLNLSWMNNTNTFIYFVLYIHHMSDSERGDQRVMPYWSAWYNHVAQAFRLRTKAANGDPEMNVPKRMLQLQAKELYTHVADRCGGSGSKHFEWFM
jgi:hypothetical protein